ncbi:HAD hydrolase-like protein [Pectobacterium brasiliense]|uniref:HAD hydrolase-like protein n=1 Tax=Pectobacterium brasiliense TaxID=180957 RepID=UPI00057DB802|nr:HAD hydrolase-like protein [Pectobacterium brasiliense]APS29876.1 haloacid dehalogenase [Pectobacterium brasiliense]KHT08044.1 haloacid dehalogenase [Pectobacterium brasiliense]MBA0196282.1 HAD hydrolase-like protein [Pectobacterium brasiliense]MBN3093298.1 HAD hydrolase-like protein [Pectobacterium brasiliense]MBN3097199.1 HAD hydrolase-like protein [Pectobacterium brasiliense]
MNIIFDLDGTIIDSVPGIRTSLVYAIRQQGHAINEFIDISVLIGPPMNTIVRTLLTPYADSRVAETVDIYREHYGLYGLNASTLYEGIRDSLEGLKSEGHRLFIATSKRQHFAKSILTNLKLYTLFIDIIGTPEDGSMDDKSLLLSNLIHKYELDIKNTIMVGDRKDDVISAHDNGLLAIGAQWGYGSHEELSHSKVDYWCQSPSQLADVVNRIMLNDINHI